MDGCDAAEVVFFLPIQALTRSELTLLQLRADGYSNKEAGVLTHHATHTMQNQLQVIYEKLGVHDLAACLVMALRQGWIT